MFLCLLLQPPGVIIQPVVLRGQHLLRVELEYAPFLRLTTVINIKVLGEHFSSLLTLCIQGEVILVFYVLKILYFTRMFCLNLQI